MKLTKSTEQAICIMLMLYYQDRRIYLNSKEISERLDISPTYLKKIMRKLVVSNIVKANTGAGGGYKYIEGKRITLCDIYDAINGSVDIFNLQSDYIAKIFNGAKDVEKRYNKYLESLKHINDSIKASMRNISIDEIAATVSGDANIRLDWNKWQEEFERMYKS